MLCAALLVGIASGAVTGSAWTRLSDPDAASGVGLARGGNGTLHVLWAKGANVYDTSVNAAGRVGSKSSVVSGWASTAGPAALAMPDGTLRAFVPGSINPGDSGPAIGVHTLTASAAGGKWVLAPDVWGGALANQRDVNAVLGKDGQPVTAVGGGGAVFFVGIANGQQPTILPPTPYSYDPEVALDAGSGTIVGLWFVNQAGQQGIVAQSVYPQGSQRFLGKASEVTAGGISGRIGAPGTYVVLATPAGVRFGRFGGALALAAKDSGVAVVDITAGPAGRLWLSWLDRGGTLRAVRTNKAASKLGPVQTVKSPAGSATSFELRSEGSEGPVDVIAHYRVGSQLAWWQTHVLPPVAVSARTSPKGLLTVKVTDVGDPVPGATVKAGGRTATTDARGVATIRGINQPGATTVSAPGYLTGKAGYR